MQRDIMEGRPSELSSQNGAVVRLGRKEGVPVPLNEFIYSSLTPLELRARGEVQFERQEPHGTCLSGGAAILCHQAIVAGHCPSLQPPDGTHLRHVGKAEHSFPVIVHQEDILHRTDCADRRELQCPLPSAEDAREGPRMQESYHDKGLNVMVSLNNPLKISLRSLSFPR